MKVNVDTTQRVQRAVEFFRKSALDRLLLKLREKYVEVGQVGGQIQLTECTPRERRDIASFLGKTPFRYSIIKLRLSEMNLALQRSSFHCTLPELLEAFFPDQPLMTRPQLRAMHISRQEKFRQALEAIADTQTDDTRGRRWLLEGQHGLDWLFARYKNAIAEEQERQLTTIKYVVTLLNRLPGTDRPMRLDLFAQRTSGDPHSLDLDRPAGRLFLQALSDITEAVRMGQGYGQDIRFYQDAGLLVDTISSYVAAFHLAVAHTTDGSVDPMIAAAGARILLLPLSQLMQWCSVSSVRGDIYVIENAQVFEEVVAHLQSDAGKRQPEVTGASTVVCTSGWPSVAALTLLDQLLMANPTSCLHYSGNMDLKGLQIATYLMERYPARCLSWHLDAAAYNLAIQVDGILARENELQLLNSLPTVFNTLIEAIQKQGKWAYQEDMIQLLLAEI